MSSPNVFRAVLTLSKQSIYASNRVGVLFRQNRYHRNRGIFSSNCLRRYRGQRRKQLPQRNVAQQHTADDAHIFNPFIDHLLLCALVAILLHANVKDLVGKTIQRRHVLVR